MQAILKIVADRELLSYWRSEMFLKMERSGVGSVGRWTASTSGWSPARLSRPLNDWQRRGSAILIQALLSQAVYVYIQTPVQGKDYSICLPL